MYECSGGCGSLGHVGLELQLLHPGWFSNLARNFTLGCTRTPFAASHSTEFISLLQQPPHVVAARAESVKFGFAA